MKEKKENEEKVFVFVSERERQRESLLNREKAFSREQKWECAS